MPRDWLDELAQFACDAIVEVGAVALAAATATSFEALQIALRHAQEVIARAFLSVRWKCGHGQT